MNSNPEVGVAQFGAPIGAPEWILSGNVVVIDDLACAPLSQEDAEKVSGNVVVINRGVCTFSNKVYHAQEAGAIAVLIANTADDLLTMAAGDFADSVTIPSVMITETYANAIRALLGSSELVTVSFNEDIYAPGAEVNHLNLQAIIATNTFDAGVVIEVSPTRQTIVKD